MTDSAVDIQGKHLKLSNLEKVLYPATGFTKQQVIDYYARIAPAHDSASGGAGADAQAVSRWRGRRTVFREERAHAQAGLGEDGSDLERAQPAHRELCAGG